MQCRAAVRKLGAAAGCLVLAALVDMMPLPAPFRPALPKLLC